MPVLYILPSVSGRKVKIVNGAYRGSFATLEAIKESKFCATLAIAEVSKHVIRDWALNIDIRWPSEVWGLKLYSCSFGWVAAVCVLCVFDLVVKLTTCDPPDSWGDW